MKKAKGIDGKLDDAWALAVKIQAGYVCEYDGCGKETHLNSHHVYSRSNRSVRWDLTNGYCLCVGHHVFGNFSAHKSPMEFSTWMREDRGEAWADALLIKSHQTMKWDKASKEMLLEALKAYIETNK
tara:strand:- start:4746 stop:5126 length:381 start_codon:yes stop_codon:yes gene_type:complete